MNLRSQLVFSLAFFLGSAIGQAAPPETAAQFRELRSQGKTAELAQAYDQQDELVNRPLEAWIVGEALLAEQRPHDALQLAEVLTRTLPASYAGVFLRFREAQSRGDTAAAREFAKKTVARPYDPLRLERPPEGAGLLTRASGPRMQVEFVNKAPNPVRLSWVDSVGKLVAFGTLDKGQTRTVTTYEGHVWDAALPSGESLGRWEAFPGNGGAGGLERVEVGPRSLAPIQTTAAGTSDAQNPPGSARRRAAVNAWYRSPIDLVLMGKLRLAGGADPKLVMETCYERALREDPECEEAFEAVIELALDKSDAQLASRRAREALKRFPQNAHLRALLGRSLEGASAREAQAAFASALERNPRERTALVALAEFAFSREDREGLRACLDKMPASEVEGAAFRLADGLLNSDGARSEELRKPHAHNPQVLHLAGVLLSSRYRFNEGAALQKAALDLDPGFREARRALAEDLLRTAQSEQAWALVEQVQQEDAYDVTAFNLLELRDRIANFTKVQTPHFEIWMEPSEATVFGDRVEALLERAHATLTKKYGIKLPRSTVVEIFAQQSDFAVRTFGVPGGDGFLGVCFGPVITAPSPASPRASGHSWEATLWHEFAHTVTLTMTRNRMPRWLSEGISVHEEQQANPGWGQRFRPRHASRVLNGKLTPIEDMAAAFRSGQMQEIDFAYFQAGLIVDWLVKKGGMPALRALLEDLGKGQEINAALTKRYGAMEKLNAEFLKYAEAWARSLAGSLKWKAAEKPKAEGASVEKDKKESAEPETVEELLITAHQATRKKDWEAARGALEKLVERAPQVRDPEGAYPMLARVYRQLGLEAEETAVLEKAIAVLTDLPGGHERLLDLYEKQQAWTQVERICGLGLGIMPMSLRMIEASIRAAEMTGHTQAAISACNKALLLDPNRAARWHSRLGRLLAPQAPDAARVHLLEALESNPRDHAALEVLAAIHPKDSTPPPTETGPESIPPQSKPENPKR